MKFICALVTVSNMERARRFYEDILNQKVKYDFGENVTYHGDFAIHLGSHFENLLDNKKIIYGNHSFELYFEEDKIEELVDQLKSNNVEFIHELREQPWRQKVVRFYDPDKNIIEIGESLEYLSFRLFKEGMSLEDISKTTNLPVEFTKMSIDKILINH